METGILKPKPTILIADDDESTRMLLRATISQWDFPTLEAKDGEEALKILSGSNPPEMATIDWIMPKIDGIALCAMLNKKEKRPYIILLTSLSGTANSIQALDSGADDFLVKPINYAELRSRIMVGLRVINYERRLKERRKNHSLENKEADILMKEISQLQLELNTQCNQFMKTDSEDRQRFEAIHKALTIKITLLKHVLAQIGIIKG